MPENTGSAPGAVVAPPDFGTDSAAAPVATDPAAAPAAADDHHTVDGPPGGFQFDPVSAAPPADAPAEAPPVTAPIVIDGPPEFDVATAPPPAFDAPADAPVPTNEAPAPVAPGLETLPPPVAEMPPPTPPVADAPLAPPADAPVPPPVDAPLAPPAEAAPVAPAPPVAPPAPEMTAPLVPSEPPPPVAAPVPAPAAPVADSGIVEETIVAPRRAATSTWQVQWGGGQKMVLARPVVFGRAPNPPAGFEQAHLVTVDDPDRSVSSTHAVVEDAGGTVRVRDLGSTNGTLVVTADGREQLVAAGTTVAVPEGASIEIGAYPITLVRAE